MGENKSRSGFFSAAYIFCALSALWRACEFIGNGEYIVSKLPLVLRFLGSPATANILLVISIFLLVVVFVSSNKEELSVIRRPGDAWLFVWGTHRVLFLVTVAASAILLGLYFVGKPIAHQSAADNANLTPTTTAPRPSSEPNPRVAGSLDAPPGESKNPASFAPKSPLQGTPSLRAEPYATIAAAFPGEQNSTLFTLVLRISNDGAPSVVENWNLVVTLKDGSIFRTSPYILICPSVSFNHHGEKPLVLYPVNDFLRNVNQLIPFDGKATGYIMFKAENLKQTRSLGAKLKLSFADSRRRIYSLNGEIADDSEPNPTFYPGLQLPEFANASQPPSSDSRKKQREAPESTAGAPTSDAQDPQSSRTAVDKCPPGIAVVVMDDSTISDNIGCGIQTIGPVCVLIKGHSYIQRNSGGGVCSESTPSPTPPATGPKQ